MIDLVGSGQKIAAAISADGTSILAKPSVVGFPSQRWTASTGWELLPNSYATDISSDGNTVVTSFGAGDHVNLLTRYEVNGIASWEQTSTFGGLIPNSIMEARAITPDASVVVGRAGLGEAFRWTSLGGIVGLGYLPGFDNSDAMGVSADGSVVIGYGGNQSGPKGFRWTESDGMQELAGLIFPYAASHDGSVIVGDGANGATIWDATNGSRNLMTLLIQGYGLDLSEWTSLSSAYAISQDGKVIAGIGTHNGQAEYWLAKLDASPVPLPSGIWLFGSALIAGLSLQKKMSVRIG